MKKSLFLLLLSFSALAQDSTKNSSRFQIGVSLMPELNYRPYKDFNGKTYWNYQETSKSGLNLGLSIQYNFSNKVAVESGLQFTRQRFYSHHKDLIPGDAISPNGTIDSSKLVTFISNESFNYIVIPLKLHLFFGNGKFRFMASPGIAAYYLLNIKIKSTQLLPFQKSSIHTYSDYQGANNLSFGQSLSLGIEYRMNKDLSIRVLPTFRRMNLSNIAADYSESWLAGGVDFGVYYNL
jgi:hypothetical protein